MLFICPWFKSMIFGKVTTIDQFYTHSAAIWHQLDSLRTTVCGTCPCCQTVRSNVEFQRVYEFLSRLRKEFKPRRAEDTRLRDIGLLDGPSVLATHWFVVACSIDSFAAICSATFTHSSGSVPDSWPRWLGVWLSTLPSLHIHIV
jgi:hypothetical protein